MIANRIGDAIEKTLKEMGVKGIGFTLEHPTEESHGDFSTNAALILAKKEKKNPRELAEKIVNKLQATSDKLQAIDKIEVAGPGFVNFYISRSVLVGELEKVDKNYGKGEDLKGKKIMVEFADPNPFKQFHIGHMRNIAYGESFCRLLESQGAQVWRVNYQGDVGMHVAKAIYGLGQMIKNKELVINALEEKPLSERVRVLGKAYAEGAQAFKKDEAVRKEIGELNKAIYKKDPEVMKLWKKGKEWSLEGFEEIYKRVGTKFERYYFESEVAEEGKKKVMNGMSKGIFEESKGAIVFPGEKYGLHTRVFVSGEGNATYEAKDMALAGLKYKDYQYDKSYILTATEQSEYFKVVIEALKKVEPELGKKTFHKAFGFVDLKQGKMSSREGNVVTGERLFWSAFWRPQVCVKARSIPFKARNWGFW